MDTRDGISEFYRGKDGDHALHNFDSQLRPHQYNGGLTPNESERLFWQNSKTVANFS